MLDLWQNNTDVTAAPQPNEARDLPSTFGENFEAAWNEGRLFSQSIAGENARLGAIDDHIADIKDKTGKDIASQIDWASLAGADNITADMMLDQVNAASAKLGVPALSADDLEQKAVDKSRAAQTAYAAMAAREKGSGGGVGQFLGGAAAAATDPMNLALLPLAPETGSVGILSAALRWGAVAGVSQAAIEARGAPFHEEVQPGYLDSGAPLENIASAAGQGMLLGGATRFLGNAWTRVKTGAWPQSVRDAGNVVESEANIASTNIYPGAAGEVAHREALASSIDNILNGRPVDVADQITPELETQAQGLVARLEGERAMSLPIFDERAIRLTSEEAGLREQDAGLASQLEGLPEGDFSAADRLNRLQAVEQQLAGATDAATKRALSDRRDQILVDTTPEALRAGAAPIEQRRQLGAQREQIASRLAEIEAERNQISLENASRAPASMIGQTEPSRAVPVEAIRSQAAEASTAAEAARAPTGESQPGLPSPLLDPTLGKVRAMGTPMDIVAKWAKDPEAVHDSIEDIVGTIKQAEKGLKQKYGVRKVEDLEDAPLTKAESDFLFYGKDHTDAEYWRDMSRQLQPVDSLPEAAQEIAHEMKRLPKDVNNLSTSDEMVIARLQVLFSEVGRLGGDLKSVLGEAAKRYGARFGDPEDAIFMVQNAGEQLRSLFAARGPARPQQLSIPFEANAAEARAQIAHDALGSGVAQIAKRAGYDMPAEEAATIAAKMVKMTPEEAANTLRDLQMSPRQVAEAPVRDVSPAATPRVGVEPPEKIVGTPDHDAAMRADIDRERMTGDRQIPVGVDAEGNAVMRSLDGAMDEVDALKKAADEIQACAAPAPEPTEEAA